jgi:hypothetical protein
VDTRVGTEELPYVGIADEGKVVGVRALGVRDLAHKVGTARHVLR